MKKIIVFISLLISSLSIAAEERAYLAPSAGIPPAYKNLSPSEMVNEARFDFSSLKREDSVAFRVERTTGFTVTDPDGNTFVVDNIDKPNCAFYGTYVDPNNDSLAFADAEIISNIYVEEINFDNCQPN